MGAIAIRCPECGATIPAETKAVVATCEYCGTRSQIRRRTRFLEIAQPPPPRPDGPPLPVAMQRHSARWMTGLFVVPLLISGIVAASTFATRAGEQGTAGGAGPTSLRAPRWDGTRGVVPVDVDGDGTVDVVGRAAVLQPEHRILIGAWHGTSGKRLWLSAPVGLHRDLVHGTVAVAGDVILLDDGVGGVSAFSLADGKPRWSTRLDEKVEAFCAGSEGLVWIQTADEQRHPIALADGSVRPSGDAPPCRPLPSDRVRGDRHGWAVWDGIRVRDLVPRDKIEGMNARHALHHRASGVNIALGHRQPGSRVPLIAAYQWPAEDEVDVAALQREARETKDARRRLELLRAAREADQARRDRAPKVLWTAQVPGIDPLTVREGAPDPQQVAVDGEVVVVVYQTRKSYEFRLAAFAFRDGRPLWDVEVPGDKPLATVDLSPTHVLVSRWGALHAFDRATGKLTFSIH